MKFVSAAFLLATAAVSAQDGEVTINIPSTIAELSTECPAAMAKISPCTGGEGVDLEACSTCVSLSILENDDLVASIQDVDTARDNAAANACENLQDGVCNAVETCAESCGILQQESFFTFGSDCEEIFLDLVGCVLSTQDVGQDCPIVSCTADGDAVDDTNNSGATMTGAAAAVTVMGIAAALV